MLQLILGRAGTGKTTRVYELIKEFAAAGKKIILIVPEQSSFEAERTIEKALGGAGALCVQVVSFTRLYNRIFRQYGGVSGNYIDPPARAIIMSIVLSELKDELALYGRHENDINFIESAIGLIDEFKNSGVAPARLLEAAESIETASAGKLKELAAIYAAYDAIIQKGLDDSADDARRALRLLDEHDFFSDKIVFIDSFAAFMKNEYDFIKRIVAGAERCFISLCTHSTTDDEQGTGAVSAASFTAARLMRIAAESEVECASSVVLGENLRFENPSLGLVEKKLFAMPASEPAGAACGAVRAVKAANPYDEIKYISAEITRLVRDEGLRYRDIAIIARSLDRYSGAVELLFERAGIPYFLDRREEVENHPLATLLLLSLEAALGGAGGGDLVRIAKNPVLAADVVDIALLENYCYVWSVGFDDWFMPFDKNPQGLYGAPDDDGIAALEKIEALRLRVITPLVGLKKRLETKTAKGFAEAVLTFLLETQADQNLRREGDELSPRLWDIIIAILDDLVQIMGRRETPAKALAAIFASALRSVDLGVIPQTCDQVLVGTADRIRPEGPKAVFVIGACEGEFPLSAADSGMLSTPDRDALEAAGVELSMNPRQKLMLERYYAYSACTAASKRLYVSCPSSTMQGEKLTESVIFTTVKTLFKDAFLPTSECERIDFVMSEATALDELASQGDGAFRESVIEALKDSEGVRRLATAKSYNPFAIESRDTAQRIFEKNMRLSPTNIEKYFSCPFSYFCKNALKAKERKKVEFSPIQSGTAVHFVLSEMFSRMSAEEITKLDAAGIKSIVLELLQEYLASVAGETSSLSGRFKYLYTRLCNTVVKLIERISSELLQTEFRPARFEMPISPGAEVAPLEIKLEDGGSLSVHGVVDRVDILKKNGKKYIRVVDYKTGKKEFLLRDVACGLNMQMLIYLFCIVKNAAGELGGGVPAGVLYMPASVEAARRDRGATESEIDAEIEHNLAQKGLVLAEEEVIRAMDSTGGVFIPVSFNKDNSISKTSSVATLEELGGLSRHVESLIAQMAQKLHSGIIAPAPKQRGSSHSCDYCEYRPICKVEDDRFTVKVKSISNSEFLASLAKESEGDANG